MQLKCTFLYFMQKKKKLEMKLCLIATSRPLTAVPILPLTFWGKKLSDSKRNCCLLQISEYTGLRIAIFVWGREREKGRKMAWNLFVDFSPPICPYEKALYLPWSFSSAMKMRLAKWMPLPKDGVSHFCSCVLIVSPSLQGKKRRGHFFLPHSPYFPSMIPTRNTCPYFYIFCWGSKV